MRFSAAIMIGIALAGCATTSTYATEVPAREMYGEPGTVESVRQVVRRVQGQPGMGAVAGALIGGLLFGGHGVRSLFGAAAGAGAGAALSEGSYETRAFEVVIRFDDGERGVFTYRDFSPLRPGDRVVLGPGGPEPLEG